MRPGFSSLRIKMTCPPQLERCGAGPTVQSLYYRCGAACFHTPAAAAGLVSDPPPPSSIFPNPPRPSPRNRATIAVSTRSTQQQDRSVRDDDDGFRGASEGVCPSSRPRQQRLSSVLFLYVSRICQREALF
jgi:hypothetical protein